MLSAVMGMHVRRMIEMLRAQEEPPPGLAELAECARLEWQAAQAQFNEVRETDLVDHAIFRLQAAERHYIYLLRQAGRGAQSTSGEGNAIDSVQG